MSIFDFFSSTVSDKDAGTEVLKAYYDEASYFPEFTYGSYEAWLIWLNSMGIPNFDEFVGELVKANSASTTIAQAASRVADLANKSGGQATTSQIVSAAGGKGDTINWSQAIPEIGYVTGSQLVESAQNVGQGVLSTANLMRYMPWILGVGGTIYIIYLAKSMGGGIGKSAQTLAEGASRSMRTLSEAGAERLRRRK